MPFTESTSQSAVASTLLGAWIHDVTDPAGTLVQYLYTGSGRTETIGVDGTAMDTIGRSYPIVEFGIAENSTLDLSFQIPYEDNENIQDAVDHFRDLVNNRNTLVYRDNRGRLVYGVVTDLTITDEKWGQSVSFKLQASNYLEELQ
jgi:hypothetical protein